MLESGLGLGCGGFCLAGALGEGEQMKRTDVFGAFDKPAGFEQRGLHEREIENVVVEAAVVGIEEGPCPEGLMPAGPGIAAQIVQGENLFEVSEIVICGSTGEVFTQVSERGYGPPLIERMRTVGQKKHEMAAGPNHAKPFTKSRERVCDMLEAMGRQDEVVGVIWYTLQIGGFAQELAARRPRGVEVEFTAVAQAGLPRGLRGEVHVVDAGGHRVDREDFARKENTAGAADFQARATGYGREDVGPKNGVGGTKPVIGGRGQRAGIGMTEPTAENEETGGNSHGGFVRTRAGAGEIFVPGRVFGGGD